MNQDEVLKVFRDSGAFLEGHFLLSSGLHSGQYVQCARLFENPQVAEKLVKDLAARVASLQVDWVIGPAMGGILFAYALARELKVRNAFTERVSGAMTLRRGFEIPTGSKALIAEDVLTTGGSALEVARYLESREVKVMGITALVDRGGKPLTYPTYSLLKLKLETATQETCSLCQQGKPVTKPGSRVTA